MLSPLFAVAFSHEQVGLLILAPVCIALAVGFFFRKGAEFFSRHEAYGEVAHFFADLKLEHLSSIFTKLAIGNHIGVMKEIEYLVKTIKDPDQRKVLVASTFYSLLSVFADDPAEWPKILKAVQAKLDVIGSQKSRDVAALQATTPETTVATQAATATTASGSGLTAEQIQKVMGKLS